MNGKRKFSIISLLYLFNVEYRGKQEKQVEEVESGMTGIDALGWKINYGTRMGVNEEIFRWIERENSTL